MSDDRNDGTVPPAPESAPPPLAAAPPPVSPPQPAPAAAPPQHPAATSRTGLWAMMTVIAFGAGVGLTLLVLWLNGSIGESRRGSADAPASTYNANPFGGTGATPSPPAPSYGNVPTAASLQGTWGPRCPGSRDDAATFYADGTMEADGETGSWTLSGNDLTVTTPRQTMTLRWEMLGNNSANVTRSGGNSRVVNRCG